MWSGAEIQSAEMQSGPPQSLNEYLFTGLAPVSTMQLVTAPRWLIVLVASASVLALALGRIYVPALRRPWVLGALACLLAGFALHFPRRRLLVAEPPRWDLCWRCWPLSSAPGRATRRGAWLFRRVELTARLHLALKSIVMPPVAATASTSPTVPLRVPESE